MKILIFLIFIISLQTSFITSNKFFKDQKKDKVAFLNFDNLLPICDALVDNFLAGFSSVPIEENKCLKSLKPFNAYLKLGMYDILYSIKEGKTSYYNTFTEVYSLFQNIKDVAPTCNIKLLIAQLTLATTAYGQFQIGFNLSLDMQNITSYLFDAIKSVYTSKDFKGLAFNVGKIVSSGLDYQIS